MLKNKKEARLHMNPIEPWNPLPRELQELAERLPSALRIFSVRRPAQHHLQPRHPVDRGRPPRSPPGTRRHGSECQCCPRR